MFFSEYNYFEPHVGAMIVGTMIVGAMTVGAMRRPQSGLCILVFNLFY